MKHLITQDGEPVSSEKRSSTANTLPVFFFNGPLTTGLSGFWAPPHEIRLVNGWVMAKTQGSTLMGLAVLKDSGNLVFNQVMTTVQMPANRQRATFTFAQAMTISPYEQLYIASFSDSNHEDVSVQIYGERV